MAPGNLLFDYYYLGKSPKLMRAKPQDRKIAKDAKTKEQSPKPSPDSKKADEDQQKKKKKTPPKSDIELSAEQEKELIRLGNTKGKWPDIAIALGKTNREINKLKGRYKELISKDGEQKDQSSESKAEDQAPKQPKPQNDQKLSETEVTTLREICNAERDGLWDRVAVAFFDKTGRKENPDDLRHLCS